MYNIRGSYYALVQYRAFGIVVNNGSLPRFLLSCCLPMYIRLLPLFPLPFCLLPPLPPPTHTPSPRPPPTTHPPNPSPLWQETVQYTRSLGLLLADPPWPWQLTPVYFNTLFAHYRFLKMPNAAELQQKTYQVFGDIEAGHTITGDMLITAADEQEHGKIMLKVLECAIQ